MKDYVKLCADTRRDLEEWATSALSAHETPASWGPLLSARVTDCCHPADQTAVTKVTGHNGTHCRTSVE